MWNWLKRKGSKHPAPVPSAGQRTAERALKHEDRKLRDVNSRTGEIMAAAEGLKTLGEQNDFAGRLRRAMGGAS